MSCVASSAEADMCSQSSRAHFPAAAAALALLAASCGGDPMVPEGDSGEAREIGDGYGGADAALHAAVDVPEGAPKVVFLGDSLTAGLHLAPSNAFPAAVQRQLADEGVPFELQNAGVSGDTSRGGLARLDWIMKGGPDVVVIGLGANDALRGQSVEATEQNLREIVERVRAGGARPVLLGMDAPQNLGEYAADFAAMYPRISEELDVPLVPRFLDGVGGVPEMNLPDGMHPTPEGHDRLAENVAPVLRGLLERAPESAAGGGD